MRKKESDSNEKFTDQGWKNVLREISNYAPKMYESKANYDKKYPLVKKSKIKPHELPLIMNFLQKQGLIKYDESKTKLIILTSKGLDVALQVQGQRLNFRANYTIVLFTAIITFMTVVDIVQKGVNSFNLIAMIVFLGVLMFYAFRIK
jgi:predicted transcriptional regulator